MKERFLWTTDNHDKLKSK